MLRRVRPGGVHHNMSCGYREFGVRGGENEVDGARRVVYGHCGRFSSFWTFPERFVGEE